MSGASDSGDRSSGETRAHVVGVYERDDDLVTAVAPYLAGAAADGGTAIVIATSEHRAALATALDGRGVPRGELERAGRYCAFDARATLERFMVDGCPDACAFTDVVGGMVASAARSGPVRLYGEMVGLLWDDGDLAGALAVETLWNELAERHAFALFCSYSMSSLDAADDLAAAKAICDRHTAVAPLPMRIPVVAGDDIPDELTRLFVAAPTAPQDVRAFVRSTLAAWGENHLDGEAEIVASELATNAVRHARSPFRVSLTRRASAIRIAVRDASFAAPEHQSRDHSVAGGRGVRLVAALSRAWGADPETDGKTVWADVPRSA